MPNNITTVNNSVPPSYIIVEKVDMQYSPYGSGAILKMPDMLWSTISAIIPLPSFYMPQIIVVAPGVLCLEVI